MSEYEHVSIDQVTNLYLYGQDTTPTDEIQNFSSDLIRQASATTAIQLDVVPFMSTGAGRFALGPESPVVADFFNDNSLAPGEYTKADLGAHYGLAYYGIKLEQYQLADGTDDYAERAYIWNTGAFKLADDAVFVVAQDGTHYIENYAIIPDGSENFDLVSNSLVAQLGNAWLHSRIDSSGLGRTVDIDFVGTVAGVTYTAADYNHDVSTMSTWATLPEANLPSAGSSITQALFNSGTTSFIDLDGRAVNWGSDQDDTIYSHSLQGNSFLGDAAASVGQTFVMGAGADAVILDYGGDTGAFVVDGGAGNDAVDASELTHSGLTSTHLGMLNVEQVVGSGLNDWITLGGSPDFTGGSVAAGTGNDSIQGSWANDTLDGGDGNDLLTTGSSTQYVNGYEQAVSGDSVILGGSGDDFIKTPDGYGADTISGGAGNDLFDLRNGGWGTTVVESGDFGHDELMLTRLSPAGVPTDGLTTAPDGMGGEIDFPGLSKDDVTIYFAVHYELQEWWQGYLDPEKYMVVDEKWGTFVLVDNTTGSSVTLGDGYEYHYQADPTFGAENGDHDVWTIDANLGYLVFNDGALNSDDGTADLINPQLNGEFGNWLASHYEEGSVADAYAAEGAWGVTLHSADQFTFIYRDLNPPE